MSTKDERGYSFNNKRNHNVSLFVTIKSHTGGFMYCVCGREFDSTNASPWLSSIIVDGKVISGTCVHGIYFPPKESYEDYVQRRKEEIKYTPWIKQI